jgi:tripartite-type tricarboxylate transporter receptor subunit TctC
VSLAFPTSLAPVYFAFVAPAGTPKPIIQRLYEDISRIGNEPAFRKQRLIDIGIEPVFDTPEQFGRFLAEQRLNAARLIRESGLQPR